MKAVCRVVCASTTVEDHEKWSFANPAVPSNCEALSSKSGTGHFSRRSRGAVGVDADMVAARL